MQLICKKKRKIRDENPFFQIILNKVLLLINPKLMQNVKQQVTKT